MPPGIPTLRGDLYVLFRSRSPLQEQLRPDSRHPCWASVGSSLRKIDKCPVDEETEEFVGREVKSMGRQEGEAERADDGSRHGRG